MKKIRSREYRLWTGERNIPKRMSRDKFAIYTAWKQFQLVARHVFLDKYLDKKAAEDKVAQVSQ